MTDGEDNDIAKLLQQLTEQNSIITELRQQDAASSERADMLNQFVMRVAGASSVEEVLSKGFKSLSAQLEPLRDLTPRRTLLSYEALKLLGDLRKSLDRPDWSNGRAFTDDDLDALSPDAPIEEKGDAL